MKSIYPISTSLRAANCRFSWESAAMGVEYLFMGDGSQHYGQITEGNNDLRYLNIGVLIAKPQINTESGRYRLRQTVPT
ncbi:MAG: hypothetical protein KME21_16780 [Desmonostoc vinosum HA7617-LM4]|nr:hypothetical protein [Desmonostoc vinosum HA7617-LM4]